MKHSIIILLVLALAVSPTAAQKRRRTSAAASSPPLTEQARQAIASYNFERAVDLLEKEIATLHKKRQNTDEAEALLRIANEGSLKLHATERIVVIDSLVCDKDKVLTVIRLSQESGRIDTYASTYHTTDQRGATLYENELGNRRYLAVPAKGEASALRLAVTDKLGEQWSDPTLLTGLNETDESQNFPFLLADGVTLYYAAKGPESIGGYDIFVTRSDGEDASFLTPENVGFPFNSTANDYLLAIDEANELGWFVSDRLQPEGKVCVYTFIPRSTRETYGDETSDEQLRSLARLTSIRDTWNGEEKKAQARLAQLRNATSVPTSTQQQFYFPIDDNRTYTQLEQFRSKEAKELMRQWLTLSKNAETDATMLQRLRDSFATANPQQRQQLARTIHNLETTYYPQLQQLQQLAKEIRNIEINFK